VVAVGRHHGHGFAIVACDHAAHELACGTGELDGLANAEVHYFAVGADLLYESETLHDHVVQLEELILREQLKHGQDTGKVLVGSVAKGAEIISRTHENIMVETGQIVEDSCFLIPLWRPA
jgi:hypothetical protein